MRLASGTCHNTELTSLLDQVGSDILWTDVISQQCQGSSPCFSSPDQPIWYAFLPCVSTCLLHGRKTVPGKLYHNLSFSAANSGRHC